jgi:hypothetical protein
VAGLSGLGDPSGLDVFSMVCVFDLGTRYTDNTYKCNGKNGQGVNVMGKKEEKN